MAVFPCSRCPRPSRIQVENFRLRDHVRVSHHGQLELWSREFTFQVPPSLIFFIPCPACAPDSENPSTSGISLVRIEDVLKHFEATLGGLIMFVRCIPGHQVSQMNQYVLHLFCKISHCPCHRSLNLLTPPPSSPPPDPERRPRRSRTYHPFLSGTSAFILLTQIDPCPIVQGNLVMRMANIYRWDLPLFHVQLKRLMTGPHSPMACNSSLQISFTVKRKCHRETSTIFLNYGRFL